MRPEQNGRHFEATIFKFIFWNEIPIVLIQIPLKFIVSEGQTDFRHHWFRFEQAKWQLPGSQRLKFCYENTSISLLLCRKLGTILCMCPANERWHYIVTPSLIDWAHTQNDPCNGITI